MLLMKLQHAYFGNSFSNSELLMGMSKEEVITAGLELGYSERWEYCSGSGYYGECGSCWWYT